MNKHTPGPWTFRNQQYARDFMIEKGERPVAIVFNGHAAEETNLANACLIVAAPELLAWAKDFADRIPSNMLGADSADSLRMLRKAIAKAEGR
jgi:hypothetical protein